MATCANPQYSSGFHILALSGGGYRGLYTATVLKDLEQALGAPLASRFDLLCGTSAGGLLALGLAAGVPASALQQTFINEGRTIFGGREWWRRGPLAKWIFAKHSTAGLRSVLRNLFGTTTLGDLHQRVIVPAVSCTTGKTRVFKTPHSRSFERDYQLELVDVALATTAAPTYFPLHRIVDVGVFADGGLVANSPGYFGFHEATQFLDVPAGAPIRVLAVGTMTSGCALGGSQSLDRGLGRWSKLFDLTIASQESSTDFMLQQQLKDRYVRVDTMASGGQLKDVRALDCFSDGAVRTLTECGSHAAQSTLGLPGFAEFRSHNAARPTFYYGARATRAESSHAEPEFAVPFNR